MNPVIIGNATLYNMDCMDFLRQQPDKSFDLAIVDPPYGIGIANNPVRQAHTKKQWDSAIPNEAYFKELQRVSNNQIIWGGNYFLDYLGATQGFLIWDKKQPHDFSLAMCELAWMSFQKPAKIFSYSVLSGDEKIHPTQKPVKLYEWLLQNYAKQGERILDTHLGSGSSSIAAKNFGCDFVACELDSDYFEAACNRLRKAHEQIDIFAPPVMKQEQVSFL